VSTVLLIEDDVSLRALVQLLLERAGYVVKTASSGVAALATIDAAMPDLILLDMRMPLMSGLEFAQQYRARYPEATRAPIVVVTAAEHAARQAQEVGAQGFLSKPFSNQELVRTVAKHLQNSHTAQPGDLR
jgi:CheY-like chemotaxis protein